MKEKVEKSNWIKKVIFTKHTQMLTTFSLPKSPLGQTSKKKGDFIKVDEHKNWIVDMATWNAIVF